MNDRKLAFATPCSFRETALGCRTFLMEITPVCFDSSTANGTEQWLLSIRLFRGFQHGSLTTRSGWRLAFGAGAKKNTPQVAAQKTLRVRTVDAVNSKS